MIPIFWGMLRGAETKEGICMGIFNFQLYSTPNAHFVSMFKWFVYRPSQHSHYSYTKFLDMLFL